MSDRLEENKVFEQAVKGFSEKQGSRPYLTDKLEGFSSGWLAAREFFTTEVKRLREEMDRLWKLENYGEDRIRFVRVDESEMILFPDTEAAEAEVKRLKKVYARCAEYRGFYQSFWERAEAEVKRLRECYDTQSRFLVNEKERLFDEIEAAEAQLAETQKETEIAVNEAWDEVLDALKQAWPDEMLVYDMSPCELIIRIINERDDVQAQLAEKDRRIRELKADLEDAQSVIVQVRKCACCCSDCFGKLLDYGPCQALAEKGAEDGR
jgi:chromosome segregation ATPase